MRLFSIKLFLFFVQLLLHTAELFLEIVVCLYYRLQMLKLLLQLLLPEVAFFDLLVISQQSFLASRDLA
jgi:hypothetical protein